VIVGAGQVVNRPSLGDPESWTDPLSLMVRALEAAGEDASGVAGQRSALLDHVDEMDAIPSFVWQAHDPARAVAMRLGLSPGRTRLAFAGGTLPQSTLFDAATRIAAGDLDVVVIVGAEAIRSRALARRAGGDSLVSLEGRAHEGDGVDAEVYGQVPAASLPREREAGLALPVSAYALFENAVRAARGWSRHDHLSELGQIAQRMALVASRNEYAWIRDAPSATEIVSTTATNRMVSTPYPKLLTSNVGVDMGAALIVTSLEAARVARVPDAQLVFPTAGAKGLEQWLISERQNLGRSLAMEAICGRLFGGRTGAPGIDHLDLYSCFPVAVQMAADALGIHLVDDPRPPSTTGGMTFFGGPGNNYVTHSLVTMVDTLRKEPGTTGLVTGLGWYASTHAWGTYSTTPPASAFQVTDVQSEVDAAEKHDVDDGFVGVGTVESYTVTYDRDSGPHRVIVAATTPSGARTIASSGDADLAAHFEEIDPLGGSVSVRDGKVEAL
jgi:acetyl-CoA C-acetyltransferase